MLRDAFQVCGDTDNAAWQARGVIRREEVIPQVDGSPRILDVIKAPAFDREGRRKRITVIGRDITERKQAENALMRSEANLQALINNIPIEFWAMDRNLCYTMQNAASIKNNGNVVGRRIQDLGLPPEIGEKWLKQDRKVLKGEIAREKYMKDVAGECRVYENCVAPVIVGTENYWDRRGRDRPDCSAGVPSRRFRKHAQSWSIVWRSAPPNWPGLMMT